MANWKSIIKHYIFKTLNFKKCATIKVCFENKNVIEIGGPSKIFNNGHFSVLPIYDCVSSLSNVNFSFETIWEKKITEGNTFKYGKRVGIQFIQEASDLNQINNSSYDCLISSHCLEHTANPIKVINEWKRVIVKNGFLLIVVPNKDFTFDQKRKFTTIEHLMIDFENNVDETDLFHLVEILEFHDIEKDPGLKGVDFKERSLNNFKNRCLHHHVFNDDLMQNIANFTNLKVIQNSKFGIHLIYLLQKND